MRSRRVTDAVLKCGGDRSSPDVSLLAHRADDELRVRADLLDGGDVHLARAETGRALVVLDHVPMRLARGAEVDLFGIGVANVAHHFAVLAEEQPAVRI